MSFVLAAVAKAPASAAPAPLQSPASTANVMQQQPATQTWVAQHLGWLTHGLAGLAVILAIALIVLLAVQTTKQEGLSGTIGGRVESAYRGRPGMEESLKRLTGFVAMSLVVVWAVLSLTGI